MAKEQVSEQELLGLDLKPGDNHYRAFVGPPKDYDFVSAMVFNLLTCLGLRQHHRVLDIGCGSLRCGRLLIPYLNKGNYYGVEPNRWLVDDGVRHEIGQDMVRIKEPNFSYSDSINGWGDRINIDYAFAQSVFSHSGKDVIRSWFEGVSNHLNDDGVFLITFLPSDQDFEKTGWVYPECVYYRPKTITNLASEFGFSFTALDWFHPRQTWALLSKSDRVSKLIVDGNISWNNSSSR